MGIAIQKADNKVTHPVICVPAPDLAPFSATIIRYPRKVIARAAGVSEQAVKMWRLGKSKPTTTHLQRLAQQIPEVKKWHLAQLGVGDADFMEAHVRAIANAVLNQLRSES